MLLMRLGLTRNQPDYTFLELAHNTTSRENVNNVDLRQPIACKRFAFSIPYNGERAI
jgi:hypothetical protein